MSKLFGPDPVVEQLRSENAFLRSQIEALQGQVAALQKQLIAMADKPAYRALYPPPPEPQREPGPAKLSPYRRNVPFGKPPIDNEAAHAAFREPEDEAPQKAG